MSPNTTTTGMSSTTSTTSEQQRHSHPPQERPPYPPPHPPHQKRMKVAATTTTTTTTTTTKNDEAPSAASVTKALIARFGHLLSREFQQKCFCVSMNSSSSSSSVTPAATAAMSAAAAVSPSPPPSSSSQSQSQSPPLPSQSQQPQSQSQSSESYPFPHSIVNALFDTTFLQQVLYDIKQSSRVQYKESDLFKVYQSMDFANLPPTPTPNHDTNTNSNTTIDTGGTGSTNRTEVVTADTTTTTTATSSTNTSTTSTAVLQLRDFLYSTEFRHYMEVLHDLPHNSLLLSVSTSTSSSSSSSSSDGRNDDSGGNDTTVIQTSNNNSNNTTTPIAAMTIDCACNCHVTGCHLLCHDDVIGTRTISFILYLTDPDGEDDVWEECDGGALELYHSYPQNTNARNDTDTTSDDFDRDTNNTTLRIPHTIPCTTIVPIFNRMVSFVVRPGYSFHAVQEVFGSRPRLSIQGWYHSASTITPTTTTTSIEDGGEIENGMGNPSSTTPGHPHDNNNNNNNNTTTTTNYQSATLQRLKSFPTKNNNNHTVPNEEDTEGPYTPIVYNNNDTNINNNNDDDNDPNATSHSVPADDDTATVPQLSDADRNYLSRFMNDIYLTHTAMMDIRNRFSKDSSIQLRDFLTSVVDTNTADTDTTTTTDSDTNNTTTTNNNDHTDHDHSIHTLLQKEMVQPYGNNSTSGSDVCQRFYQWGVSSVWKSIGPPHKQRFLEYNSTNTAESSPPQQTEEDTSNSDRIGSMLQDIKQQLFQSLEFYNYLSIVTNLNCRPSSYRGRVRRFRPGRDYTVAHYGLLTERSVLDATLCFVKETDTDDNTTGSDRKDSEQKLQTGTTQKEKEIVPENANSGSYAMTDAMDLWQSGDCGGFECYISADDDYDMHENSHNKNIKTNTASAKDDEYNVNDDDDDDDDINDDETELLNVSASNNTLSLVYRDPGTMRFIKYVSMMAPSSRYDIAMEYEFPDTGNDDDDEEEDDDEAGLDDDNESDAIDENGDDIGDGEIKMDDDDEIGNDDDDDDDAAERNQDVNSDEEWRI